jgi:hypothetical protein
MIPFMASSAPSRPARRLLVLFGSAGAGLNRSGHQPHATQGAPSRPRGAQSPGNVAVYTNRPNPASRWKPAPGLDQPGRVTPGQT